VGKFGLSPIYQPAFEFYPTTEEQNVSGNSDCKWSRPYDSAYLANVYEAMSFTYQTSPSQYEILRSLSFAGVPSDH
jgi:hypothetical protein